MLYRIMRSRISVIILSLLFGALCLFADSGGLKSKVSGIYSSFSANFSYSSGGGSVSTGKIFYRYPGNLHVRFSDGKVIAANGIHVWLFNPSTMICAKQTLAGSGGVGGGVLGLIRGDYTMRQVNNRFIYDSETERISQVIVDTNNSMIKNLRITIGDKVYNFSFSNVVIGGNAPASYFTYKPPTDAQLVENPLNRYVR